MSDEKPPEHSTNSRNKNRIVIPEIPTGREHKNVPHDIKMRPTPSERLERIEDGEGVLYLSGNYRRRVLAALQQAYRDGWKAAQNG
jgi:hypothetical protein